MINEITQTAHLRPSWAEIVMAIILASMLLLNAVATYATTTYQPDCIPAILEDTE